MPLLEVLVLSNVSNLRGLDLPGLSLDARRPRSAEFAQPDSTWHVRRTCLKRQPTGDLDGRRIRDHNDGKSASRRHCAPLLVRLHVLAFPNGSARGSPDVATHASAGSRMLLLSRTVLLLTPMMQPPHAAPPCCRHVAPHLCADPPSADQLLMEAMTELRGGEAPKARALLSEARTLRRLTRHCGIDFLRDAS